MINEIQKYGNYLSVGINNNKSKIVLCHSSREANEYLSSLKYRFNGKYRKIPNYFITQEGIILELIKPEEYSFYLKESESNEDSIVICLENLGWLEKETLNNYHINWIGNIYKGKVFEKKWRDYFFWHPYTEEQVISCAKLCNMLLKTFSIDKKYIGHNTKVDGIEHFDGILTKSNIKQDYTDLSPAFNFELFIKYLEDEQT